MLTSEPWGFVKDPIYGYVALSRLEKELIDTRVLQRLRRLRQLAGAEYVYPGANHTRFEHAIGTMHLAGLFAEKITDSDEEAQALRLAGLFHDIGHGPFSHIFEFLLSRQNRNHEDISTWLVKESEIAEILEKAGIDAKELSQLAVGKHPGKQKSYFNQAIRSSIDADKMDYIVRDSFHTGAEYGNVDVFRLIYTIEIFQGNLAVNTTALSTLEAFLIARVLSFRSIYYHRVGRAVQLMLAKALDLADTEIGLSDFKTPGEFLDLDDYRTWTLLKDCPASRPIMEKIERRDILKCAYNVESIVQDHPTMDLFSKEQVRYQIEQEIGVKAKVNPELIQIDSPLLPSVPYRHASQLDPMEIPGFAYIGKKKVPVKIAQISRVITALKGYLDIVRVYTTARYRRQVGKAAQEVLGGTPYVSEISM